MSKAARMVLGAVIIIIIAAGIIIAATHKSNSKTNNSSSGTANTSQSTKTPAVNNSIIETKSDPTLGQYLADPSGRALYTYNLDTANTSNCTGSCLAAWPAYVATSTAASLPSGITTFKRSDNGAMQYAYNGKPLYFFASDSGGHVTGNNVENFAVAKPVATSSSQNSSSSNSSSSSGYPY